MRPMKNHNSNERLRYLINHLGISQSEFCRRAHIQKSALSNYLKGDRLPRQDQIAKIADAFDINPAWLMGYDVPMISREQIYDQTIIEELREKKFLYAVDKIHHKDDTYKYADLLYAAEGCTDEQILIAIETLMAFKKSNKKEDKS